MTALTFRDARADDLATIVGIYNSTVASRMVTADTEPVSVESRKKWFEEHSPGKRPIWMVEDTDREIVGWASIGSFYGRPAYDGTVEVSIYLDENHRSKGYGKEILKYCVDNVAQYEIKTLLAFIFSHNEPSLRLFRNFGFEVWGILPDVAMLDGEEKSLHILGRKVN